MVAYAALVSLLQTLDTVLEPGGPPVSIIKSQLRSLHEKVRILLDFLENSSSCGKINESLETKIRDAAYEAGDIIESHISKQLRSTCFGLFSNFFLITAKSFKVVSVVIHWVLIVCTQFFMADVHVKPISLQSLVPVIFVTVMCTPFIIHVLTRYLLIILFDDVTYMLYAVKYDISCITEEVIKIKDACGSVAQELVHQNVLSRRDLTGFGKNVVVGFNSDLIEIKTWLTSASPKIEIVSIVGVGGIGKTTLARVVYDEYCSMVHHFDTCAWVTISQEYNLRLFLLGLLETAGKLTEEMSEYKEEKLSLCLYQSLKCRRYLIIMDEIWDTEIWDAVKMSFPEDNNESRVVLTTRLALVALYASSFSSVLQMCFLNQEESWKLLCSKVFGGEFCPQELEGIGKKIAQKCGGLPLAIAVIGGLLSKVSRETKTWESVADNLSSIETKDGEQCMEILSLSYSHLPHHLRACFLYMGVFQEDYEIPVTNLIRLWDAEGFLRPSRF